MVYIDRVGDDQARRVTRAVTAVLPAGVKVTTRTLPEPGSVEMSIAGHRARVRWVPEGTTTQLRAALDRDPRPDIVVARRWWERARALAEHERVGVVDEVGNAEIAIGTIVVSRTAARAGHPPATLRWTDSALATAEAVLSGVPPRVRPVAEALKVTLTTAGKSLMYLTEQGLLDRDAERGKNSGRRVGDPDRLLAAYADAARGQPARFSLRLGAIWRDPIEGMVKAGARMRADGHQWACTGALSAAILAPLLTQISPWVLYVDARGNGELEAAARAASLKPAEGGRLELRPFPTAGTRALSSEIGSGVISAPWPRVYVDLLSSGVRGEEAAEHLHEVMSRDA